MKKTLLFLTTIFLIAGTNFAQTVYRNAPLSTGNVAEDGTLAPSGYYWSELQHNAGDNTASNNILAFTGSYGTGFNYSVADNFSVPVGEEWSITGFNTYVLLVDYAGTTSPIDQLHFRIFDGPPNLPGSHIIYGDFTTNRYSNGVDSLMYRIGNTVVPARTTPVFDYKIWKVEGTASVILPAGNYWIEWQTHGVGGLINYFPPATIKGSRGDESYNGKQHNVTSNAWTDLIDGGNPASAPDYIQDMPFEIVYTNTLPVTFKSFDGVMQNGQSLLKWTTTNEINNKGFDVERSTDGQIFTPIGFVAGQNSSNVENNYTYTDVKPVNGVNYYRLKQIDNDGRFAYSSIIQLKNVIADFAWNVYPNPVINNGWMQVQLPNSAKVSVQVVSSTGTLISMTDKGTLQTGTYSIPLNLDKAAKGIYIVKLILDNKTYSKTIVK